MLVLYFSATGNSLYVAKKLSANVYSIPKAIKENNFTFSDDKIGIVFPVYENEAPKYVEEFLNKVKLKSNYIFAIGTYGQLCGPISSHLQEIAIRNNFKFSYISQVKMVDNYIPGFNMKKQIENEPKKNVESQIEKVKKDVYNNVIYSKKDSFVTKAFVSFMKNTVLASTEKKMGVYKKSFDNALSIDSSCIKCGTCVKVCPVDNIALDNNKHPQFKGKCIGCLSCTHNCPKSSIRVSGEKSKDRFRNKNISLKEIIDSNN